MLCAFSVFAGIVAATNWNTLLLVVNWMEVFFGILEDVAGDESFYVNGRNYYFSVDSNNTNRNNSGQKILDDDDKVLVP